MLFGLESAILVAILISATTSFHSPIYGPYAEESIQLIWSIYWISVVVSRFGLFFKQSSSSTSSSTTSPSLVKSISTSLLLGITSICVSLVPLISLVSFRIHQMVMEAVIKLSTERGNNGEGSTADESKNMIERLFKSILTGLINNYITVGGNLESMINGVQKPWIFSRLCIIISMGPCIILLGMLYWRSSTARLSMVFSGMVHSDKVMVIDNGGDDEKTKYKKKTDDKLNSGYKKVNNTRDNNVNRLFDALGDLVLVVPMACMTLFLKSGNVFNQKVKSVWVGSVMPHEVIFVVAGLLFVGCALVGWVLERDGGVKVKGDSKVGKKKYGVKSATTRYFGVMSSGLAAVGVIVISMIFFPQCRRGLPPPTSKGQYLLSRTHSTTGYISVAIDTTATQDPIMVMRSDHSLIGGVFAKGSMLEGESVYGCFYLLEFVRGVKQWNQKKDPVKVLNIGLGVGIAAKELLKDGAHVDIVELDGAVVNYAVEHFGIPSNRTGNATLFVGDGRAFLTGTTESVYDYVLHDVFTNGGLPPLLFSYEALREVRRVLVLGGVLAMNFVGKLDLPSTRTLLTTLQAVFSHIDCYMERPLDELDESFYNMVFYASDNPIHLDTKTLIRKPLKSNGQVRYHMLDQLDRLKCPLGAIPPSPRPKSISKIESGGDEDTSMVTFAQMQDMGELGGRDLEVELMRVGVITDSRNPIANGIDGDGERDGDGVSSRDGHWGLMIEMFGWDFWMMF
ncbi:hypothetical protein HDU76_009489 [Blyttiomyces sp. JEL0837]|nr:hypothetical protein HDU76_009489 [Blyttiomyces sp. JEL0837]